MNTFLYTRHSPKNRAYPEQLNTLRTFAPKAVHFEDKVRGCTPPAEIDTLFSNSSTPFNPVTLSYFGG